MQREHEREEHGERERIEDQEPLSRSARTASSRWTCAHAVHRRRAGNDTTPASGLFACAAIVRAKAQRRTHFGVLWISRLPPEEAAAPRVKRAPARESPATRRRRSLQPPSNPSSCATRAAKPDITVIVLRQMRRFMAGFRRWVFSRNAAGARTEHAREIAGGGAPVPKLRGCSRTTNSRAHPTWSPGSAISVQRLPGQHEPGRRKSDLIRDLSHRAGKDREWSRYHNDSATHCECFECRER
jgi:hypothetical protein